MLKIPVNAKIIEWPTSTMWFDEDGILYSIQKKGVEQTIEEAKMYIEEFKKIVGNKKSCMLVDVTNTSETSREMRDYAAEVLPDVIKAVAMVSDSALGKMLANLFFTIKAQPYPTKMFNNEADARKWLMQYL